jgi:16S rRNA (adenine1518-N6/adenine1519-N6)-dimethyltransferase
MCVGAGAESRSTILEIGPGLGTLTARLLERGCEVYALEFDHDLAAALVQNVERLTNRKIIGDKLKVIEGDIRTFDFQKLPVDYKICANIPYYLTSNLIRLLCDTDNKPNQAALLMQKEVAQRIAALDGKMSLVSCITHFYYECHLSDLVPARLFTPPPKVDSQILILVRRSELLFDVDTRQFFSILRAGFSGKRKTLRNTISAGLSIKKDDAVMLLEKAQIDPMRRAETLAS